jgi:hypothetical protein
LEDFGTPIERIKFSGWSKIANQEEQMEEFSIEVKYKTMLIETPLLNPFLKTSIKWEWYHTNEASKINKVSPSGVFLI